MTKQTCVACLKQFAECDCLDLPEKDGCDFYYYYNRHVENLARWARAFGLLMIALCVISEAKAAPVCAEKQDAYKLALADMQGTGEKLWNELVAEGKCANVPARYLWTMDTYKHPEFTNVSCIWTTRLWFNNRSAFGPLVDRRSPAPTARHGTA